MGYGYWAVDLCGRCRGQHSHSAQGGHPSPPLEGGAGIKVGRYSFKGKAGKKGGQGAAQLTVRYICCAVALRCASFARRMQISTPLEFSRLYFFELPTRYLLALPHPCCLHLPV